MPKLGTAISISAHLCALLIAVASISCGGGGQTPSNSVSAPITVSISPLSASVPVGLTQQFTVNLTNTQNTAVTWQVDGRTGGGTTSGTISTFGLYTAPNQVPSPAVVTVLAVSQADSTKSASASVTVIQVKVTINPASATLAPNATLQFTAMVSGISNTALTWDVNGQIGGNSSYGTITGSGLYTAPSIVPSPPAVLVTAISQGDPTQSATAVVTIASQVGVTISPSSVTLATSQVQTFIATVTGTTNTTVTWQVNGNVGGNSTVGTITQGGVYTAPATVPTPSMVDVIAVSEADTTKSATAIVTIAPPPGAPNQAAQPLPIKLGTSGGDSLDTTTSGNTITCCSGTLGSLVERAGTFYILSNNHVLARSNQAKAGEPVTQPGLVDRNCNPATPVANLSQFVQLPQGGTSTAPKTGTVDAAIAQIISGAVDTSGNILELGTASSIPNVPNPAPPASSTVAPAIGMGVAKAGRSSGLTCSTISSVNTIVDIDYSTSSSGGTSFTVEYDNQIVINGGSFSAAGDSGSLVVDTNTAQPVGLLYGGDTTSTVANPIGTVLNALADSQGNVPTIVGGGQHAIIACRTMAGAAPASAQATAPLAATEVARSTEAADRDAARLMANPVVAGVVVGRSQDEPGSGAVVIYVRSLPNPATFPAQLEGVRTRIVPVSTAQGGSASAVPAVAVAETEVARVAAIKQQHAEQLLRENPAIFGVGVGASDDSPGEAAVVLFVDKDMSYTPPLVLDGARIKVVRSDRFRAWGWNEKQQRPKSCARPQSKQHGNGHVFPQ